MISIFTGRITERTKEKLKLQTAQGFYEIPLKRIVEVNNATDFETFDLTGKEARILKVDERFWIRVDSHD